MELYLYMPILWGSLTEHTIFKLSNARIFEKGSEVMRIKNYVYNFMVRYLLIMRFLSTVLV